VGAAEPRPITRQEIAAHLKFLSSDLLEGRGVGTPGGRLAENYVESVFQRNGLEPAFGTSYRQELELRRVVPDPAMKLETVGKGESASFGALGADFVASFPKPETGGRIEADLVFAGYGIEAPPWTWDDFKDADVKGKVLLVLAGEPGGDDPALFEGKALTYFGRWTTKFEMAARKGAAGVLLVHSVAGAGYSWDVVRNGWTRGSSFDPARKDLLDLLGWLSEARAAELLKRAGLDLAALRKSAEARSFRPVPLGLKVRASARPAYETVRTANVGGVIRCGKPDAPVVVVSAHHDHLGVGNPEKGDAIYNGAIDNGSAIASMLALSRRLAERTPGGVDLLFLAPAAEEEGLIGSAYFARNPPVPAARIVADLNLEMTAVWGEAKDLVAIGARHSQLQDVIETVARRHGMSVTPEANPEQGFFFRSDQFSFARAGIPGAWIDLGDDLAGKPAGTGKALRDAYRLGRYHHPSDEFDPAWELTGTVQLCGLVTEIVDEIDRRGGRIAWKAGAPFSR
jgi:Zn-dependent M28 family amino/carboxypeptidase